MNKEGSRLSFVSSLFLIYFLAGGEFHGSSINIQMINLAFKNQVAIIFIAWVYLFWCAFRYKQVDNTSSKRIFSNKIQEIDISNLKVETKIIGYLNVTLGVDCNHVFLKYLDTQQSVRFKLKTMLNKDTKLLLERNGFELTFHGTDNSVGNKSSYVHLYEIRSDLGKKNEALIKSVKKMVWHFLIINDQSILTKNVPWLLYFGAVGVGLFYLLKGLSIYFNASPFVSACIQFSYIIIALFIVVQLLRKM